MCEPATIAYGLITVATTAATAYQADQQADNANKSAEIQFDIESRRAHDEQQSRENQLQVEALQESERLNQERQQLALELLRAEAGERVATAESGTGGVSAIRSFISQEVAADLAASDIEKNAELTQFNINQRNRGTATAAQNRQENAFLTRQSSRVRGTNALDIGIGLGGAASGLLAPSASREISNMGKKSGGGKK